MSHESVLPQAVLNSARDNAKSTLRLLTTKACNFKCGYCYEEGRPGSNNHVPSFLTDEDFQRIVEVGVSSCGINRISLAGGEPGLNLKRTEKLAQKCEELGVPVYVTSNGSNPKLVELAKKFPHLEFRISMDYFNREQFWKNRGVDAYSTVLANVRQVAALGNPLMINRVTISLEDEMDQLQVMTSEIKANGLNKENVSLRVIPCHKNAIAPEITHTEYIDYLEQMGVTDIRLINNLHQLMYVFNINDIPIVVRTKGLFAPKCCPDEAKKCSEGVGYIRVNPDGPIQPCLEKQVGLIPPKASDEQLIGQIQLAQAYIGNLFVQ